MDCNFSGGLVSERHIEDQENELVALGEKSRGGLPGADLTL